MRMKKWIAVVLVLCMVLAWLPAREVHAEEHVEAQAAEIASGVCGWDLTWTLSEDGVLFISGKGEMYDYGEFGIGEPAPWSDYADQIKELMIADTVTTIGYEAFRNCTALTSLEMPSGISTLGTKAFYGCTGLTTVTIGSEIQNIGMFEFAFAGCTNLTDVYLESVEIIAYKGQGWWDYSCLMEYAQHFYVVSSAEKVSDVIRMGFACDNAPETVEVNGVIYDMYTKGTHSYSITENAPTCTENGVEIHACDICGYAYEQSIGATGHDWNEYHICKTCGAVPQYIADGSLIVEELDVFDGMYYTADGNAVVIALDVPIAYLGGMTLMNCVDVYGDIYFSLTYWKDLVSLMNEEGFVPLTEETYAWILDVITGNPAWGETEAFLYNYLGYQILRNEVHDHQYSAFERKGSCTEPGGIANVCMICGDTYFEGSDEVIGHDYFDFVVEATCYQQGYTIYTCTVCGDVYYDDYVDQLEHNYETVVVEPTCTSEGYTTCICTLCGREDRYDFVEPTGFGPWMVTVAPTFDAPGFAYRVCVDCGLEQTMEMKQKAPSVPLPNLPQAFQNALGLLDHFYEFGTSYMIRVATDYFLDEFDFWDGVCVSAEDFEAVLRMYFEVDDATIESVRLNGNEPDWFYYDEAAQTYTFRFMGGFGGSLADREFVGYIQNGDTYEVYYATILRAYLSDALPEGVDEWEYAESLGWPEYIEYDGVVYWSGMDGYVAELGLADYGRKYTVEITENVVRILSCVDYTEADLPDHLHHHERQIVDPTCTQNGYIQYVCACGDILEGEILEMVDHDYVDGHCIFCGAEKDTTLDSGTCGENLTWTLDENGVLTISGIGAMEEYASSDDIPWVKYSDHILSVVMEEGVTSICAYAFFSHDNLVDIYIPSSVSVIGDYAFSYSGLVTIKLPEGVTSLGYGSFSNCTSLVAVELPCSLHTIGQWAFAFCASLTDVHIPEGVTTIERWAFGYCDSLVTMVFPNSVTTLGDGIFDSCYNLTTVVLPQGLTKLSNSMFTTCQSLTDIVIPESVTEIGKSAFSGCISLQKITIPEGVTKIGDAAFIGCAALTSIVIPASVTAVGMTVFRDCSSLTEITFLGDAPSIGEYTFWGVTATVYYHGSNGTWTSDVMQNYSGTITWVNLDEEEDDVIYDLPEDGSVTIPENDCFEPDTIVSVEKVEEGEIFETAADAMTSVAEDYVIFEITATKDNVTVQPNGTFTITFAIPEGYSEKLAVYYMAADGTLELLEVAVDAENRTVTVELTHFSTYILADLDTQPEPSVLMGDVNGDGKVDTTDAKLIMQYDLGIIDETALTLSVADVNGDGKIDTTDAKLIMQLDLGIITEFPKP